MGSLSLANPVKPTPSAASQPRSVVPSRISQFVWNQASATTVKPGDGYQRTGMLIAPGAYPATSLTLAGGGSAFGSMIMSTYKLKTENLPYHLGNYYILSCASPPPAEQRRAKAYLEATVKPWAGGTVQVRGAYFVTEQKAIVGTDFDTSGGKKSDAFVRNINPSAGFVVFLRAESKSSILSREDVFNFILGSSSLLRSTEES